MRRAVRLLAALLTFGLFVAGVSYAAVVATETYSTLLGQVDSGSVTGAVVNRVAHDVKVTLHDSTTARVVYPPHEERQLVARLKAHGARVKYTRRRHATTHHTLRYVGGAIVVVIVAAGGGMFLYTRRHPGPGGDATASNP